MGPALVHRRSGFPPLPSKAHHFLMGEIDFAFFRSQCVEGQGKSHREQVFCKARYFSPGCWLNPRAVKVYSFQKPREEPDADSAPESAVNRVLIVIPFLRPPEYSQCRSISNLCKRSFTVLLYFKIIFLQHIFIFDFF